MSRKLTALMLSVFMVLSLFTPFYNLKAQDANLNEGTHHTRPVDVQNAVDYKALDEVVDKEEERSFIFVTDESSKVAEKLNEVYETLNAKDVAEKGNDYLMKAGFNDAISGAIKNLDFNSQVKEKINGVLGRHQEGLFNTLKSIFSGSREEANDEGRDFNVVFSGFTMKMTTEEAMKVRESVPEVKQVFIDYTYNRPDDKPNMYHSGGMVKAPEAWGFGYDGEGRVVSVIDSGADINHPAMRLTNPDNARYDKKTINDLISEHLLKGQYLNEKFPYGYNFMDHNMNLKDTNADTGMHGMHVSGTVGANADETEAAANSGLRIRGIAPEAQILVMRVFGQDVATTNTSAYIEAIEESIILGADSMNMSLGSMSGSEQGIDLGMDLALQNAKKAGSIVAIAGGNDFYTTWGNDNPRATNPDWGVMGTPGVAESAFTVANYNNDSMVTDASVIYTDNNGKKVEVVAKAMDTIADADFSKFDSKEEYEIVDVGLGNTEADYGDQIVKDKIVLAQRGVNSFADKIKLAQKKGAAAFLLGNSEADGPDFFIIMQTQTPGLIPGYSVTNRNYKILKQNIADAKAAGKVLMIKINTEKHEMANPGEFKMNESTSWGPNPSLRLKPEISAPGGEIYSTVNDGKYESMTGTSMATPHVAGGIALVNQFLQEKKFKLEGAEKHQFIKNLMMATATPILYENTKGYYNSPRVQGAGLMNLANAVNPHLVTVTDNSDKMSNGKAVVEFGSIKNNEVLDFNLKLKNYSDKPATYKVHGIAQTDQVKDGKITFAPVKLGEESFTEVTVNANSEANFAGIIDLTGKLETAKKDQPNGFFIDGFIFFESQAAADGGKEFADLSVPYLAFYGDWASLPIIDGFADEIVFEDTPSGKTWVDKVPFWYQGTDYNDFPGKYIDQWNFTHFYSKWHDGGRMIQGYQDWSDKYLGEFAISPNGDSDKDEMSFHGVFLRNADNLKFEFINEAGEVVKTIAEPYRSTIKKNYYDQKYTEDPVWTWRGEDKNGGQVPDGNYKVKITASAQDNKSSEQEYVKTVYVDRVKPEIKLIDAKQVDNSVTIKFKATDDRSGLAWMDVIDFGKATEYGYEEVPGDEKSLIFNARFDNLDADFKLDDNMDKIWIGAMDMAGNYFERTLADIKNKGKVTFEIKSSDPTDTSFPKELPRLDYKVVDENGDEKWYYTTDTNNLMYTDYVAYYPDLFSGYTVDIKPDKFTLSGDNQTQNVEVIFTKVDDSKYGVFDLIITNGSDYPGDIKVFAVDENDNYYVVPRKTNYAADMYETKLPAGEYTIVVEGNNPDEVPELAFGNRTLVINENETSEIETRLIMIRDSFISYRFVAVGTTLKEVFGDDFEEVTAKDGSKYNILNNFDKYFDVYETESGDKLEIESAPAYVFTKDNGFEFVYFEIGVSSGTYKVVSKFDLSNYELENPLLVLNSIDDDSLLDKNTGLMVIYPNDPNTTGSLEVTTEFFTKKNVDKPNVKYELYNSRDELVEDWTNLPQGIYYLRTWVQDGFRPEREEYEVEIYEDTGLNQTLNVRWFHIGEESARKNPVVEFGVGGAETADYGEEIKLTLENVDDGKIYDINVPIGKVYYELIPNGIYKMTVNLKDGWDYIFFTDKGNGGDKTQGNPDEVAFTESYNYIELALRRTNKPDYTTDYKLVINEERLDQSANRPKYALVDATDDTRYYTTDKAEFINITPGKYTLYVDNEPTGYVADPKEQVIDIAESTDPTTNPIVTQVTVTYKKATNKIKVNSVVVDKDGNEIKTPDDFLAVQYEAYTEENGKKTYYDIGSLPVNVEVTVIPKNVKAPYALYEEDKNGIKVTLNGTDEQEITFRYIVDDERLNTADLDEAIATAEDMLKNANLEPEYKKDLEKALEAAKAYRDGDTKTQNGVFEEAGKLWDVIDAAVYMVTVTFNPDNGDSIMNKDIVEGTTVAKPEDPAKPGFTFEGWYLGDEEFDFETKVMNDITLKAKWNEIVIPTPDEPIIPEPDYPIIPDYPVIPHRPHRPTTPTKDIVKDTTKPVEKPVEEKKDYGIVETMPTIAATFSDLPENEAAGSIMNMVARGILKGMDNGKFEGELPITRAMVATVLKRLSKDQTINNVTNFTDVKDTDWFAEAVKWAQSQGLIKGYEDGTFKANNLVTRQELAVIIERFLKIHGITMEEIKELSYKDLDTLPAWSRDAIIAMAKIGLVEGQTEEMYNPASEFTREELAVMLEKIIIWVEKN